MDLSLHNTDQDAYSSGHLVLSHFGTCKCSNVETNISWTCLVSGLLSFEHPSVLWLWLCLTYCYMSYCPLQKFRFPDFSLSSFNIWICLDIIQVTFDFGCVWPTFTWVIALCKNFVFQIFLCHLLTYWLEISYIDLSWHNTGQVLILSCLTYFELSYCPLQKFSFLFSCFGILTWLFGIWICLDIIQIKFDSYCVWPDCNQIFSFVYI